MSGTRQIEFTAVIGRGGFGAVYLAQLRGPSGFRRRVAVKLMAAGHGDDPGLRARQRDEARLLGLLGHDNIVQVLELATIGGRPAVIMEYVEGADLAELQRALPERRLGPRAVVEVLAGAAAALDAAWNALDPDHARPLRVIHRDIKPANLAVTSSGAVKVLDFGIARADFDREGHTGSVQFGTPRYMAPELWLGTRADAPVDVYALGAAAWELVSGRAWERPALTTEAHAAQVDAHRGTVGALPAAVEALLRAMVAFAPGDRPRAGEVRSRALALLEDPAALPGESLAALARRVVPSLVEERRTRFATESLPGPATLGAEFETVEDPARAAPARGTGGDKRVLAAGIGLLVLGATALLAVLLQPTGRATTAPPSTIAPTTPSAPQAATPAHKPQPSSATSGASANAEAPAQVPSNGGVAGTRPRAWKSSAAHGAEGAPAPSATPPPAATTPVASESPTPSAAPAGPVMRSLRITTVPVDARVFLDGREVGRSPLTLPAVPEGAHTIAVDLEGQRGEITQTTGPSVAGVRYDFAAGTWRTLK